MLSSRNYFLLLIFETIIPTSYKMIMGNPNITCETKSGGVSTAAATKAVKITNFRYLVRLFTVTIPLLVSIITNIGN